MQQLTRQSEQSSQTARVNELQAAITRIEREMKATQLQLEKLELEGLVVCQGRQGSLSEAGESMRCSSICKSSTIVPSLHR